MKRRREDRQRFPAILQGRRELERMREIPVRDEDESGLKLELRV